MSDLQRRWRKTLSAYSLRLLPPEKRVDYLPDHTVHVYSVYRMLSAKEGRPPTASEISAYLGDIVTRQAVHYHLKKLRVAGLVDGDAKLPDQHDVTYLFAQAICLLQQWVTAHPTEELSVESAQLIHALKLADVIDKIELEQLEIPQIPEWFK